MGHSEGENPVGLSSRMPRNLEKTFNEKGIKDMEGIRPGSYDPSQFESMFRDLLGTEFSGTVPTISSVTVTETGAFVLETDQGKFEIKPDLLPPSGDTDVSGAYEVLGSQVDTLFELMATLAKALREMRASNRAAREVEHQTQMSELLQAAEKIREAGAKALVGAIVGFAVSVAMAAVSIGVSVKAAKADIGKMGAAQDLSKAQGAMEQATSKLSDAQKGLQQARQAPTLSQGIHDTVAAKGQVAQASEGVKQAQASVSSAEQAFKAASKSAAAWGGAAAASPQIGQGITQMVGGITQYASSVSMEEQKIHETRAEEHSFKAQKEGEQIQDLRELIQSILEKLRTIMELQQQAVDHVSRV